MPHDTALRELAERLGILSSYLSQDGSQIRSTSDETRVAILAAMGYDASSEERARAVLAELREREAERVAEPVRVVRESELRGGGDGRSPIPLEPPLGPGYHDVRIEVSAGGRRVETSQRLIVVPDRCVTPERPGYGIIANLYSIRGARSWGVGDLTDLAELARWSGEHGAAFVGVNPLHALRTVGGEVSPYSPVSRLYRNPAYLDIEAIPELAWCAEARAMLGEDSLQAELARIRSSDRVEYERSARLARPILEALHRCFMERGGERHRAYASYREREGRALDEFATFMALDEHFVRGSNASVTWQQWPEEYRIPASPVVREFARAHERKIDFHCWLQFELDRQLGVAADAGAKAGLSIGLYQDLAVASAPYGSDVWARPDLHATGVTFGAPPDDYSATGQNWGLTPLDPHRLRDDGYRFWIALVRSALRHAGAVRIDHVLGLFRQFWIPAGMSGADGAYVRFPTHDLMGILALESALHHAVIVGEDLGTVPPEVPGTLREWGILGTRVLLFERERDGAFHPAASYEPLSLATADTHDLPTLAGFWEGKDVRLAARLGRFPDADAERAAFRARQNDRRLLTDRLIADGALGADGCNSTDVERAPAAIGEPRQSQLPPQPPHPLPDPGTIGKPVALPDSATFRDAVHRFLSSTPAALVGISLDDLTGETEPVNVPGVTAEHFASWTRRMRTPLAELVAPPRTGQGTSLSLSPRRYRG